MRAYRPDPRTTELVDSLALDDDHPSSPPM